MSIPLSVFSAVIASWRRPARVDDEDIEATKLCHSFLDQGLGIARFRHVGGLPSCRADRLAGAFDRCSVPGRDEDLRPFCGQRRGAGAAKALACGGDKRTAPIEAKIHAHNCGVGTSIEVAATPNAKGWTCQVRIDENGRKVSDHTVEVSPSDLKRLAPNSSVEDLVKRSFEFLLEREPPSSILRRFGLGDIERYYPDYPDLIGA